MASLLGAFRKLFSSLRKPQETLANDKSTDAGTDKAEPEANNDDTKQTKEAVTDTELVDFASSHGNKPVSAIGDTKAKMMTESTTSVGSDWEVLSAPIERRAHLGTDVDAAFEIIQGPTDNDDIVENKPKKVDVIDKPDENESAAELKPESRIENENVNKNADDHVNIGKGCDENVEAVQGKAETEKKDFLREKDFPSFHDYVTEMTKQNKQVGAKDLVYKLGYMKDTTSHKMGSAIVGQYNIAQSKNHWHWIKDARYFSGLFFDQDWINENLPVTNQKSNKNKRKKKAKKNYKNENFDLPSGLCRDVRLKDNPNLERVTANAAGDGLISKKEVELGKRNKLLSSGDGKVNDSSDTPSKRCKLAKVDVTRTPRSRPEQLALGFNFHSDLVIKQSPKTINGEIIPLDTLPAPKERQEQLAVGFNYHAEQLIRDSPKTETGEVIIPGIVKSPTRRTRDQLAVGFNYHSEVMAKESPNLSAENDKERKNLKAKKKKAVNLNDRFGDENDKVENKDEEVVKYSNKITERDTLAFGFSYNSDQFLKVPLQELSNNLSDDKNVSSLTEDAVICEGRNLVEVVSDKPVTRLPAGSVW